MIKKRMDIFGGFIAGTRPLSALLRRSGLRHGPAWHEAVAKVARRVLKLPRRRALGHFVGALADPDVSVILSAIQALAELRARSVIAQLRKFGQHRNFNVRGRLVDCFVKLGGPEAEAGLIDLLKDKDELVRNDAAKGLGHLRARKSVGPLCRTLGQDLGWLVRSAAAEALGDIRASESIPALRRAMGDRNAVVRSYVAEVLGSAEDQASRPLFERLFRGRNPQDRLSAAVGLYLLGDDARLADVAFFLRSEKHRLQCRCANDLVWIVRDRDIPQAKRYLREAIRVEREPARIADFNKGIRELNRYLRKR